MFSHIQRNFFIDEFFHWNNVPVYQVFFLCHKICLYGINLLGFGNLFAIEKEPESIQYWTILTSRVLYARKYLLLFYFRTFRHVVSRQL